jgi:hypothetical protein
MSVARRARIDRHAGGDVVSHGREEQNKNRLVVEAQEGLGTLTVDPM